MKKLLLSVFVLVSFTAFCQDAPTARERTFNLLGGVGIKGYDPVAYFTQNKAVKGSKANAVAYHGVTYYFVSASTKDEFKKNPAKYEPQYGGWCAYAMGKDGAKVEVDPGYL